MANCLLLLNDGSSNLLLNDGSSKLLLNDDSCVAVSEGGGEGSKVGKSKQVGVSIYDVDQSIPPKKHLFPEWSFEVRATLIREIKTEFKSVSRFKLHQKTKRFKIGVEKFMIKERVLESLARFRTPQYHELYIKARFKIPQIVSEWESKWNYEKIIKLLENYTQIIDPKRIIKSFDFEENHDAWRVLTEAVSPKKMAKVWNELTIPQRKKLLTSMELDAKLSINPYNELPAKTRQIFESQTDAGLKSLMAAALAGSALIIAINILNSPIDTPMDIIKDMPDPVLPKPPGRDITDFTHSSSWIGHVIYDSDTDQMMIMMSGKKYLFCGVDDRTYDAFEGSPSKGEYYWRILKDRFLC